jgi:hypothetical protein
MSEKKTGKFLGIPYDFRRPTRSRFTKNIWNSEDRRLFAPRVMGWGYSINFHELARRFGLTRS